MAVTLQLTDAARDLLMRRLAREWVEVNEETRPLQSELVAAGMMEPLHSFSRRPDGAYRLTEAAGDLRDDLNEV